MIKLIILLKNIYWKLSKKVGFVLLFRDERKTIHSDKLKKYTTITGTYFLPRYAYQDVIRREIIKNRIFDNDVFELSKRYIEPNTIVIDAGANYGQMSVLFSKVYDNILVYSFEASKYIYDILKKNAEYNSRNVKPINCILSDNVGQGQLLDPQPEEIGTYGALNIKFSNNDNKEFKNNILMKRIDDFNYEKRVSIMKIDVQGWDLKVLKGSVKTIKINRMPIIFEYEKKFETEMNYNLDDYIKFFKDLDYKFETTIDGNFLVLPSEYNHNIK